jgi:hypothetical protein
MTKFAFSCVVDDDPVLVVQAFIWLNWMLRVRNVPAANIFVHSTGIKNMEFEHWLRSKNVNVVSIPKFDCASPHCNKIHQLRTFIGSDYDQVVCMDCDTVWVGERVPPVGTPVSATICHYANPPDYVLSEIFSRAGLGSINPSLACFAL